MQIGKFYSKPKHNFFAPSWEYYIGMTNVNNPLFVEDFKTYILQKEKEIVDKLKVKATMQEQHWALIP